MIVVTTPTGRIGHQVLNTLSACSEPIRVIVRDPSRLPAHIRERVMSISALGRGVPLSAGNVSASLAMDDLIASTGVHFRALTMPSFMDNILGQVGSIKSQGVFFGPISADLKLPTCATRDIAAVAARLLLDHTWSGQVHVAVLGPEDLSYNDMAHIMSEVLGRPIRFQQVAGSAFKAMLIEQGMSDAMAQGLFDMTHGLCNERACVRHPNTISP